MKLNEIRGKDTRELKLDLADLRKEYFQLSYKGGAEAIAKPHRFREIRQTIARIHTVLGERDRNGTTAGTTAAAAPVAKPVTPAAKAAPAPAKAKASKSKTSSK